MDEELEHLKMKKLKQLKNKYQTTNGENKMTDMPNTPIKISDADINDHISNFNTLIIDCWAPWCGPCRILGPIIDELAKELQGQIVFGKLNVDENQQTSLKYGIMSIPSLLVFKNGVLIDTIVGAMPKPMLKAKITLYM
jgi:thioredoxin 1